MTCTACGDNPKMDREFPSAVVEINNPEQLVLFRKVVMPATMTEEENPPVIGKYRNVILRYEDTGHIYLYSSDGIPTALEMNVPQEILDRIDDLESEDVVLHGEIGSVANNLASETQTRAAADTAINGAIVAETAARQAADVGLQGQIDAITASSDVTDIVGTYAQLQAYDTSTLGDNDIIKVLQDESQNDETTYYRWSTTTQSFTLIGEEGPYYTKSQADVLLNAKQNTLTAGTGIDITNNVISATGGAGPAVIDNLTSYSATDALSANQGRVLNERIGDLSTLTTTAKTSAVAAINELAQGGGGSNITMTNTDPGEGSPLAADNYIAVYGGDPIIMDYSTTEINTGAKWIDGKAIYKKTIDCGALPNNTTKNVAHNISNLGKIIELKGMAYNPTGLTLPIEYPHPEHHVRASVNNTNIVIGTGSDQSAFTQSYVTLYYTKSA